MYFLGLIGAVLTGLTLGLFGGGGSILIVPVLVYLFKIEPIQATAYSLFLVGIVSFIGVIKYHKLQLIDYKTAFVFAPPAFVGVYLTRSWVVPSMPQTIFTIGSFELTKSSFIMLVFAIIMILASVFMIRGGASALEEPEETSDQVRLNWWLVGIEGLVVGGVTGFVGAGGGFLIIPALVVLAKIPIKNAVATSLLIISTKSLVGFVGDLQHSQGIDWSFLLVLIALAAAGMWGGIRLSTFFKSDRLKPVFGWFVLAMGGLILLKQLLLH